MSSYDAGRQLFREQFCGVLLKKYPNLPLRIVNRIYSAFDLQRRDTIDYRDFLACLRVLRHVRTTLHSSSFPEIGRIGANAA